MTRICLWDEGREKELIIGKEYEVEEVSKYMFEVKIDSNKSIKSVKSRFKLIEKDTNLNIKNYREDIKNKLRNLGVAPYLLKDVTDFFLSTKNEIKSS